MGPMRKAFLQTYVNKQVVRTSRPIQDGQNGRGYLSQTPIDDWKTPIEFYGKVLDEDGNPVAGATADIS